MQDGVREDGMWNEVEQALSGMSRLKNRVLGISSYVSV